MTFKIETKKIRSTIEKQFFKDELPRVTDFSYGLVWQWTVTGSDEKYQKRGFYKYKIFVPSDNY